MSGGCRDLRLAGNHERLGHQRADDAGLTGPRDLDAFEGRVIPDVVGRVAVRDLPDDLAFIQAEGSYAAVRWLRERQTLNVEAAAALASAAATTRRAAAAATSRGIRAALRSICTGRDRHRRSARCCAHRYGRPCSRERAARDVVHVVLSRIGLDQTE